MLLLGSLFLHNLDLGFTFLPVTFNDSPKVLIQLPLQSIARYIPSFVVSLKEVQFLNCMQNRLALRLRWVVYGQLERLPDLFTCKHI